MNVAALTRFRKRIAEGGVATGLWVTLESPSVTEIAVALSCDWVVIDAEHGHLDWSDIVAHLRATVRSETVTLVRITELNDSTIKRVLDLGADGVVIPHVETVEEVRRAVAACRYPPEGIRGIGAERATGWGQCFREHAAEANEHVLVVPMIESATGSANLPEMLQVEGADVFFFGPADYSASMGHRGEWQVAGVAEQINQDVIEIREAGKSAGVITGSAEDYAARQRQGFQMLGLGLDAGLLTGAIRSRLSAAGRDANIRPDLSQQFE